MSSHPSSRSSFHMDPDEFRKQGHAVVDWIADYYKRIESFPVLSQVAPGEIRASLPKEAPQQPQAFDRILADVERLILPGITHWQSPNFYAFFQGNASGPGILGELISAGFGVQGMLWATSPACTELETLMLDWLVPALGLPEKFLSTNTGGGVIQDTASSATLCAVLAARERATKFASNRGGCTGKLVAYTSAQAHSSVEKAVQIAGVGRENFRLVAVDDSFALKPEALQQVIKKDTAAGSICREHNLWLHVDAAMSGTASLCPEFRCIHDGLEFADSYCFNPHKWMFTNFDCDCFYVADRKSLIQTLSVLPEYLRNKATESGAVIDYRDWQIPLGRRFRSLKLWFVLRYYGIEGLQFHIREHVRLAQDFANWVSDDVRFELAAPAPLNLVCFRLKSGDEQNQRLIDALNRSGDLYLTHTRLNDKLTLRMSIGQTNTTGRHVEKAWRRIREESDKL